MTINNIGSSKEINETKKGKTESSLASNQSAKSESPEDDEQREESFRILPHSEEKFKVQAVKEIIHNALHDTLSHHKYSKTESTKLIENLSHMIKNKVKALNDNYKYVVYVVLGEEKGAGVKAATRCLWDSEADNYAYETFMNESIFCVVCVYATYYY